MVDRVRRTASLTTWRLLDERNSSNGLPKNIATNFASTDAPKMKFLFTVSFEYRDPASPLSLTGSDSLATATFDCKSATRPNINITYADINSYNYRYKVGTKTDYGTVTVSFYDDNKNTAHNLFTEYLKAVSPIANLSPDDFKNDTLDISNFASYGPLEHKNGPLVRMTVTHHYNSAYRDSEGYYSAVQYTYINPKIQTMSWDDLDMSSSEAPLLTMTLVYDAVLINTNENIASPSIGGTVTVNNSGPEDDEGEAVENVR